MCASTASLARGRGLCGRAGVGRRRLHQSDGVRAERLQGGAQLSGPPPPPSPPHWIDASDAQVHSVSPDLARWWNVFNDPALNRLVDCAFRQNLTLRQAGFRVLEARLQLAIARGELFPQTQTANGGYHRVGEGAGSTGRQASGRRGIDVPRPVELRLQPGLGTGLLGPAAAGDHRRPGQPRRLGGQLRPGGGHHAGRHRPVLRASPHRPGRNPLSAQQRGSAAGRGEFHPIAIQCRLPLKANWTWTRP